MAAHNALWVGGEATWRTRSVCILKEGRRWEGGVGVGGVGGDRMGIPGRRGEKERWEGAVAIRKSLQENLGSSNHGAAIYNAYQVTLHFS